MKINVKKTKILPVNFTKKYDFIPKFTLENRPLDVVYNEKLLGVMIQSDCKWGGNINHMESKARKRIWHLRRLKLLRAPLHILIDVYKLYVRSRLEMAHSEIIEK